MIDESAAISSGPKVEAVVDTLKFELKAEMVPEVKLEDSLDFDTESGIGANDSSTAASLQVIYQLYTVYFAALFAYLPMIHQSYFLARFSRLKIFKMPKK